MQQVLILIGISGSGKSTFAKQFCAENPNYLRINRDDTRKSILGITLNEYWKKDKDYQQKIEMMVNELQTTAIHAALKRNLDLLIDNTHLKISYINELIKILLDFDVEIRFQLIDMNLEVCIERDKLRTDVVGEDIIRLQNQKLQTMKQNFDFTKIIRTKESRDNTKTNTHISKNLNVRNSENTESFTRIQDINLPKCVLVDIDGTVADKGNRNPFAWLRVGEDTPKITIINLVKNLRKLGYEIIFFSGRDAICRKQTIDWLCLHFNWQVTDFQLFMRAEKDSRKDNIVKKELFETVIEGKYYVEFILDDRDQVVAMWRKELGLTCLQVEYGNF
jgi:predicted kinase